MTLEHYPGMTEAELARVEAEAGKRWPLQASLIVHRVGALKPGDNIVLVVTASAHREAAFAAAEFLMDYLKTRAPFWKKETARRRRRALGRRPRQRRKRGGAVGRPTKDDRLDRFASARQPMESCFTTTTRRELPNVGVCCVPTIGIGGSLAAPPLPHHRAYGSVPRRFERLG